MTKTSRISQLLKLDSHDILSLQPQTLKIVDHGSQKAQLVEEKIHVVLQTLSLNL